MAADRSYIPANTRERERLRALVEKLHDDDLTAPVNEYWTVAGVLGHIAYWDIRVLVLAEKMCSFTRSRRGRPRALRCGSLRRRMPAWRRYLWSEWRPATRTARSTRAVASTAASTSTRSRQRCARAAE